MGCNDGMCVAPATGLKPAQTHGVQLCSGRVVITAARLAAAKGVGIELDNTAAAKAQQAVVNGKHGHEECCCWWPAIQPGNMTPFLQSSCRTVSG